MEHVAAFMLLLACGDDISACAEIPGETIAYETVQLCEEELPAQMRRAAADSPQVIGQCIEVDPAMDHSDTRIVWNMSPDGVLMASADTGADDTGLPVIAARDVPGASVQR